MGKVKPPIIKPPTLNTVDCSSRSPVAGECTGATTAGNAIACIWIKKPSRYMLKKYGWFEAHKIEMERAVKAGKIQKL